MAVSLQSQLPTPSQQGLFVPRQGSIVKLVGGLVLIASFFMPAIYIPQTQKALTAWKFADLTTLDSAAIYLLVAIVPVFYALGFTTFILMLFGRFTKEGASRTLLAVHVLALILVVGASGAALALALTFQSQLGVFLVAPGILAWLALVIQFVATWFLRAESFMWRIIRATQLCGALNLLIFAIATLTILYDTERRVDMGLVAALIGSFLLMYGNDPRHDAA